MLLCSLKKIELIFHCAFAYKKKTTPSPVVTYWFSFFYTFFFHINQKSVVDDYVLSVTFKFKGTFR